MKITSDIYQIATIPGTSDDLKADYPMGFYTNIMDKWASNANYNLYAVALQSTVAICVLDGSTFNVISCVPLNHDSCRRYFKCIGVAVSPKSDDYKSIYTYLNAG